MRATPRATNPDLHIPQSELDGIFEPAARRSARPAPRRDSLLDFSQIRTTPAAAFATADDAASDDGRTAERPSHPKPGILGRGWLVAAGLSVGVLVGLAMLAVWTVSRPAPAVTAPAAMPVEVASADEAPVAPADVEISLDEQPTVAPPAPVKVRAAPQPARKTRRSSKR